MKDKMLLYTDVTGDKVYRYEQSIVVFFQGMRKVLSTSVYNGGYHEDYRAVFNHDCTQGVGMPCKMLADTYVEHMRLVATNLGLNPDFATGMGTAAQMENAALATLAYKEITVTAIVTGGIETNGGRAGDPADFYKPLPKDLKSGTINIILLLDCDLPEGVMNRALVTCTEAKTAAIQELMAGSHYSTGLATGSGTDQTTIVANSTSPIFLESAGKHSKLGELIGRTVTVAVKEALDKQSGLNPTRQHNVLRRLERFGVTSETVWKYYLENTKEPIIKPEFLGCMEQMASSEEKLPLFVAIIHLYDEYLWDLLGEEELIHAINQLVALLLPNNGEECELVLADCTLESFRKIMNKIIALLIETA